SERLRGGFAKQDLRAVNAGGAFDAGSEVHGIANNRVAAEILGADVAHDDFTGADPDAQINGGRVPPQPRELGQFAAEAVQRSQLPPGRPASEQRMVFRPSKWGPPESHH